ncbi:MAG: glutamyl-tRNA amidotransferase [Oscillospiraceae bacterium]
MNKKNSSIDIKNARARRRYFALALSCLVLCFCITPAFAAGDNPLTAINSLSTFVFAGIRAIGIILLGWGVVQIGMSIQSHDPSQRSNGFLSFFGGLLIAFAKEILDLILA